MQTYYQKAMERIVPHTLYVVATPIGNLSDISLHALAVLTRADIIFAEDTRVTQQLLHAFGLQARLLSIREQNEQVMANKVIAALQQGYIVAQVSDAGTPAICDPGARLVTRVRDAGFQAVPVSGPSAVISALSVAGITQSDFYFAGFLPVKTQEKHRRLVSWQRVDYPVVMFEAPHRLRDTLSQMLCLYPNRTLLLAREISKRHETYLCDSVMAVHRLVADDDNQIRGEIVLVLHPAMHEKEKELDSESQRVMAILQNDLPTKQAASLAAEITQSNKKQLYDWAIKQKES